MDENVRKILEKERDNLKDLSKRMEDISNQFKEARKEISLIRQKIDLSTEEPKNM